MGLVAAVVLVAMGGWLEVQEPPAAAGCVDAAALARAVEQGLGGAPFPAGETARVRCAISAGGGLRARVELLAPTGEVNGTREIVARGGRCADLFQALTLSLTVALGTPAPEPERPRPAPEPAPTLFAVATAALATTPAPASRAPAWRAVGGVAALARTLPALAVGTTVGVRRSAASSALGGELGADFALPTRLGLTSIRAWRAWAGPVGCVPGGPADLCALARAGLWRMAGTSAAPAPIVELGARLALALGRRDELLYLEAAAPLVRTRVLAGGREVWVTPRLAVSLGFQLLAR